MTKRILFGFNDICILEDYTTIWKSFGLQVDGVGNLEEMLELANGQQHDYYVMDANLGYPDDLTIQPAVQTYKLVKDRVLRGEARFLALCIEENVYDTAKEAKIPAKIKSDFLVAVIQMVKTQEMGSMYIFLHSQ